VRAGATHLVVGRPVLHATDPADALKHLLEEARCVTS
jgi:orotidine-5'-phosphate decarboxylase